MAETNSPDCSHWLVTATTIFLIWAFLFAGVRAWAKFSRNLTWALHDNVFISALFASVAQCITIYLATSYGYGSPEQDVAEAQVLRKQKARYAGQLLYILSIGLSKCSKALFLGSLTRSRRQKRVCTITAVIAALWTVASVLVIALRGSLTAPWMETNNDRGVFNRWIGIEASGMGLEVTFMILSITLVHGLNMKFQKRLKIMALFGTRLCLIPIVAGRLFYLSQVLVHGTTFDNIIADVFTEGAMQFSLIADCLTCLKPFLQPFYPGYGYSTGSGLGSNVARDPYYELSNVKEGVVCNIELPPEVVKRDSSRHRPVRQFSQEHGALKLRPDNISFAVNVEVDHKVGRSQSIPTDAEDVELLRGSRDFGIRRTQTVSVVDESMGGR